MRLEEVVKLIYGQVLTDNAAMLTLTRKLGFEARPLANSKLCEVTLKLT